MKFSHELLNQAADWFALLRSGDATAQDKQALQHWLEAHEDHRQCWHYVESIEQCFNAASADSPQQAQDTLFNVRRRRASRRNVLTGLALLLGTGALSWRYPEWYGNASQRLAAWRSKYHTNVGEISKLILEDGSEVWLSSDTAIDTKLDKSARNIYLHKGEILVATAKADARPLIVHTAHGDLQPIGTRFSVRDEAESTVVAVFEGAVQVRNSATKIILKSGQQARLSRSMISAPQMADRRREAWSRGILLADNISLGELIDELGHFRPGVINISPEAANLRVFGGYSLLEPDKTLAALEEALPISVNHTLPWWVSIEIKK